MRLLEKFLFKKIYNWIWLFTILLSSLLFLIFFWSLYYIYNEENPHGFKNKLGHSANNVGKFLDDGLRLVDNFTTSVNPRLKKFDKFDDYEIFDNNFIDDGYILFSSININSNPITILYDLKLKKKIYTWSWPVSEIIKNTTTNQKITKCCFRAQHPLLLDDGSLVATSSEGPLVKINLNSKIDWILDRHTHHSIYLDSKKNIIVPSVLFSKPDGTIHPIRNDGYIKVNLSGEVIEEVSIIDILEKNNYYGLLYGVSGSSNKDIIHLNDAEPILKSDKFVKKDDLMFSSRNLSTVFLYRPSTNKIIWLKLGPWLKQHDIDYNQNGKFTIFDNGAIDSNASVVEEKSPTFRFKNNFNSIKEYDMKSNQVNEIFSLTKNNKIFTPLEGLHRILNNGDVFIEETMEGILHRISKNGKIRWSFVNRLNKEYIGSLHWSRYFNRSEIQLNWLKND